MYETMEIAKYIITKCSRENEPLSNLQLQKIMYYVQRDFLQNTGAPVFNDDFYAWKFGPVLEDVYYNYCNRGASKIQEEYQIINIEKATQKRIDNVVIEKRKLNPWDMVEETHKQGGAWDYVYNYGKGLGEKIDKQLIKDRG